MKPTNKRSFLPIGLGPLTVIVVLLSVAILLVVRLDRTRPDLLGTGWVTAILVALAAASFSLLAWILRSFRRGMAHERAAASRES